MNEGILHYNDAEHIYSVNDVILPSVTQIIKAEGLMGYMNTDDYYMIRGGLVHTMIKLYLDNNLDEEYLDETLQSYLSGIKRFFAITGFVVQGYEKPLHHPVYQFAGTPDLWGIWNDKKTVVDFKTGSPARWHLVQVAAYNELLGGGHDIVTVYLREDNNPSIRQSYNRAEKNNAWYVFLSALTLWQWKNQAK